MWVVVYGVTVPNLKMNHVSRMWNSDADIDIIKVRDGVCYRPSDFMWRFIFDSCYILFIGFIF